MTCGTSGCPLIAWALLTAADGWFFYVRKPISESEIKREIERQAGPRADSWPQVEHRFSAHWAAPRGLVMV